MYKILKKNFCSRKHVQNAKRLLSLQIRIPFVESRMTKVKYDGNYVLYYK